MRSGGQREGVQLVGTRLDLSEEIFVAQMPRTPPREQIFAPTEVFFLEACKWLCASSGKRQRGALGLISTRFGRRTLKYEV